jgi:hypothetical protein
MTTEPKLNESPLTTTGRLRVAQERARACWNVLVKHCEAGRCTCNLGVCGSVNILNACVVGRMLSDEYIIAKARVQELAQINLPLEAGDMGSTLEVDHIEEYRADPAFRVRT